MTLPLLHKKTATKLAIALAIFFLALSAKAHAEIILQPTSGNITGSVVCSIGSNNVWDGIESSLPATDIPETFSGGVLCSDGTPTTGGFELQGLIGQDISSCPDDGFCYVVYQEYDGDTGEKVGDPVIFSYEQNSTSNNPNIFFPNSGNLDQIAGVGQVASGTIGGIWPLFLMFFGIPLAFVIIGYIKALVPDDKDEKLEKIKATTEEMKSEHRGDEIVEKLSHGRKRTPPLAM